MFPDLVWKAFGEHVGESELNEDVDRVSFAHLGGLPGQALGSPNIRAGSLGPGGAVQGRLGVFRGSRIYVLGRLWERIGLPPWPVRLMVNMSLTCVPRRRLRVFRGTLVGIVDSNASLARALR